MNRYDEIRRGFRWDVPVRFNIAEACCGRWAKDQNRLALRWEDEGGETAAYTFRDIQQQANRLSNALAALGVKARDRVAIMLPQRPETAIAYMAILQMGAIVVPLSHLFGIDALEYRLENAGECVAIVEPTTLPRLWQIRDHLPQLKHVISTGGARESGVLSWESLIAGGKDHFSPHETLADDPAFILYTSGTTGAAKGALLAHRTLLGNLPGFVHSHDFYPQPGDMFWSPADWAWTGGLMDALLPAWTFGQPLLGYRGRFDAGKAFYLLEKYAVRNAFIFPTALKVMMKEVPDPAAKYDLKLRTLMSAGESVGVPLMEWAHQHLHVTINEMFGQTEANYVVGNCQAAWPVKPGSIGRPYPGHDVVIIDASGLEAPRGALGEIAVRRGDDPVMFLEYWRNPEATAAKFTGDWALTGDQGRMDEDGYIWYQGRTDDVIKSAGYRIGPADIESCLLRHPAVANAAVVGKPDAARGMIIKAFIILQPGSAQSAALVENIQNHVRERLALYQYPREIEFVASLPMTPTGKIQRVELRKRDAPGGSDPVPAAARTVICSIDDDGVGWLKFEDPGSGANVFNEATRRTFVDALAKAESAGPRALVIMSGKPKVFIAGADLRALAQLSDAGSAEAFARDGQAMLQRIADLSFPVVCAIHGACAGGGYELALACHWRMASDAPETRIGLPETGLGTIPGWGGCVRLPRLIGVETALAHIVNARLVPAADALTAGMVDAVVPATELRLRAKGAALTLAGKGKPKRSTPPPVPAGFFAEMRRQVRDRPEGGSAAVLEAVNVVEQGVGLDEKAALVIEARGFAAVTPGAECKQRIQAFFDRKK
ncbi:MAG: AMP-binding protein [Verrucomicrobia bacterium]|nr:AMP-binding protein [Verrucomicrobiota bacterium]